jgi:dolichol-phosphate mannosyltransferase
MRVTVHNRHFFALVADIGFKATVFPYQRCSRSGRPLGLPTGQALRLGLAILFHNSRQPLRFAGLVGVIGSLVSVAYASYTVLVYLLKEGVAPGWTTLSLVLSGLFFLAFVMLALMTEYIGVLLDELPGRPLFHVEAEEASHTMLVDELRRNVLDRPE